MKKVGSLMILLLMLLHISAFAAPKKTVTLNMRDVSMETFLDEVRRQTDVNFLYNSQLLKGESVTVKAAKEDWESVVGRVLDEHDLMYEMKNAVCVIRK